MSKGDRLRFIVGLIINVAIVGLVIYCLISLSKSAMNGKNRFFYFTNISNLTVGFVALINTVFLALSIIKRQNYVPRALSLIKLIAISMTTLTFFTVLFVIGPVDGHAKNYSGRNLYTHLIVPLLAPISYLFFEEKLLLEWRYSLLMLVPLAIYSIFYVVNVVFTGDWPYIYRINEKGLWYLFLLAFLVADFAFCQGLFFLKRLIDKKFYQNNC